MAKVKIKRMIPHAITWVLLIVSVLFGIFYFGMPIIKRLWMAICDLGRSLAAYGILLFTWKDGVITPTVQQFPQEMDTVLPLSWEELELFLGVWWNIFKSGKNMLAYLWLAFEKIALFFSYLSLMILPILALFFVLWLTHRSIDNKHAKDTKALKVFEKIRRVTWWKCKAAISFYIGFVKTHWCYCLPLLLIWAYNLNILTIAFEAVAWIFYVAWAGSLEGILNIFVQVAKFAVDFSVVALFIPGWCWWIIIYWLFTRWRHKRGMKALERCIEQDYEFIDRYPGALFVTGKQRSKKTSMLAMLKMLFERIFRKKADEKMLLRDKQFPFFPWINLEKFIEKNRCEHKIYMLYHCRRVIRWLRKIERLPAGPQRDRYFSILKKKYNYTWDDFYFGYDVAYGLEYDDGLMKVHLYEALEMYAQLYFVYRQSTPLDLSNLAIREDFEWEDHGNFPIFDGDLLKRDASESAAASKYSHVIDFDGFRPGLKFDPDNPNRNAIEHGIGVVQEVDKERKNSKTRSSAGNKGDGELGLATQDNDGFEIDLKVRGQVALVDNVDFWVWLIDAQRVGDLGASNAELTNQIFIKGRAEEQLVLPFFEIEDLLFEWLTKIYNGIHRWFRLRKGSNTLLHHILKLFYEPFFKAHDRIEKKFTAWKLRVKVTDGGDGEELGVEHFWILSYVTYRDRFASDVCKAFYEYRFAKSPRGIDDIECYTETDTNVKMMIKQNSYFAEDMTVYNGIESRRRRVEQRTKNGRKSHRK